MYVILSILHVGLNFCKENVFLQRALTRSLLGGRRCGEHSSYTENRTCDRYEIVPADAVGAATHGHFPRSRLCFLLYREVCVHCIIRNQQETETPGSLSQTCSPSIPLPASPWLTTYRWESWVTPPSSPDSETCLQLVTEFWHLFEETSLAVKLLRVSAFSSEKCPRLSLNPSWHIVAEPPSERKGRLSARPPRSSSLQRKCNPRAASGLWAMS